MIAPFLFADCCSLIYEEFGIQVFGIPRDLVHFAVVLMFEFAWYVHTRRKDPIIKVCVKKRES